MKRLFALFLVLCLACVSTAALAEYADGQYTGTGNGNNGPISVTVTIEDGRIASVEIGDNAETPEISGPAFESIPGAIVEAQSAQVDSVAGATHSSQGVMDAVADALVQAGGEVPVTRLDADVIVVGGGAAGMGAASNAVDAGASVLLFEKQSHLGGNTMLSGGYVYATGTQDQKDAGVEDSVEDLVAYWQMRAEGHADEALLTLVAEKSNDTVEWLRANGVELVFAGPTGTSPVPRALITGVGGTGFTTPVEATIREKGVQVCLNTPVTGLLTDDSGKVVGVTAEDIDGNLYEAYAKGGVVIATGGFDASEEMKRAYAPTIADEICYSNAGNTGDGIRYAMAVGAATLFHDGAIGLRGIRNTSFADPLLAPIWMTTLLVDSQGNRVCDESSDYPVLHTKLKENGSSYFYLICDAAQAAPMQEIIDQLAAENYAFTGETLEDLATATWLDQETFAATVERYNALTGQEDTDFGKAAELMTGIGEGPYTAIRVVPTTIGSLGGICINTDTQVLKPDGSVIEGLYAAGACANGQFFYREYPASGTSIMMCFTLGRIAGTNAAALAE